MMSCRGAVYNALGARTWKRSITGLSIAFGSFVYVIASPAATGAGDLSALLSSFPTCPTSSAPYVSPTTPPPAPTRSNECTVDPSTAVVGTQIIPDKLTPANRSTSVPLAATSTLNGENFTQNGQNAGVASYGVLAVLQAPQVSFPSSPSLMYNWIGDQNNVNGGNLNQIGIFDNVGNLNCTVTNVDVVVAEEMVNGTYVTPTCYPQFVFTPGSTSYFFTYWYASYSAWVDYVYYNHAWQGVVGYSMPQLPGPTTANQTLIDVVPNEGYYPIGGSPYTFTADTDVVSYLTNASLGQAAWTSSATYQFSGQSSNLPYCLVTKVAYWEVAGTYC
ncbi:MAG: hypothetical protein ACRDYC_13725 [Acidimicrobiales bacterium]